MSVIFGLALSTTPATQDIRTPAEPALAMHLAVETFQPAKGDRFIADTKNNLGYIVHENGSYTSFLIASGRNEKVRYLGMTYVATTPVKTWKASKVNTQPDRITFGKKGTFLRLDDTRYGIHDYAYLDEILEKDVSGRFFSMGCILVKDEILQILLKIRELNGGVLEVATVYGVQNDLIAKK